MAGELAARRAELAGIGATGVGGGGAGGASGALLLIVNNALASRLVVPPATVAIALIVVVALTAIGPVYLVEFDVGVVPSTV